MQHIRQIQRWVFFAQDISKVQDFIGYFAKHFSCLEVNALIKDRWFVEPLRQILVAVELKGKEIEGGEVLRPRADKETHISTIKLCILDTYAIRNCGMGSVGIS